MGKACLLYADIIDAATAYASSEQATLPAANAVGASRRKVWRSAPGVNPVTIAFDAGAAFTVDVVTALETNLSAAGQFRVQTGGSRDFSPASYDSGWLPASSGALDLPTRQLVHVLTSRSSSDGTHPYLLREDGSYVLREDGSKILLEESGYYVGISLDDASLPYHEIGKVVAGALSQPGFNYSWGWQWIARDLSQIATAIGGASYADLRTILRGVDVTFEALTDAEARDFAYQILMQNGSSRPLLVILNPASASLGRDTVWGRNEAELAVVFTDPGRRAHRLRVIERY
jgi:hypothetical protein